MNTDTLFKCLNFNAIIRLSDRGKGNAEVLSQSEDDFWINQFQISIGLFWQTGPAGARRWGRDEPLSPPVFYLLYWQPLICNIAKILNRHRRYLDPRSPGTQTRPLSVTIILITDQVPSLPAIFRSFMCQILLRPRTFIKYFCQWNSKTFPPPHLKQSSIVESRIIASQKVRKVGINFSIRNDVGITGE